MTDFERKLIDWTERNYLIIGALVFTVIKVIVSWRIGGFISDDMRGCLLPWFETIKEGGGIASLSQQVGSYGIPYQTLIALMTYIPVYPVILYKLLSLGFDLLLGASAGALVWELKGRTEDGLSAAVVTYCIIIISPLVQLNSAVWGQCDSIYTAFLVLSVLFLCRKKTLLSFLMLGLAFSFQLQSIFLLPVFIIVYVKTKDFSILSFLIIPSMMIATGFMGLIMGRSVFDVFTIYLQQTDEFHRISGSCPSLGTLLCTDNQYYKYVSAILISLCILFFFVLIYRVLRDRRPLDGRYLLRLSLISAFAPVLLLPAMHERYTYPAEIFAVILAVIDRKTIPCAVLMTAVSFVTYGYYLFKRPMISPGLLAFVYLLIFLWYLYTGFISPKNAADIPASDSCNR